MTLLSRITSRDKDHGDKPAEAPSQKPSVGRDEVEPKPSLLRRLSRRNSASKGQKPKEMGLGESSIFRQVMEAPLFNSTPRPAVAEKSHTTTDHANSRPTSPQMAPVGPSPTSHSMESSPVGQAVTTPGHSVANASMATTHLHSSHSKKGHGLSKEDVHRLFSGAPQFMLEKGKRGRYFPQVFFPWNNELEISDLQDRRYCRHESFALSTLHAHLPVPDEVGWKPGMAPPEEVAKLDSGKRPMFELGIFERPNMLSMEGSEPGTVGMRYFLERPVADGVDGQTKEHGKDVDLDLAMLSVSTEAFRMLGANKDDHSDTKIGKHAPPQDRTKLIEGGPHVWKTVGVREITMQAFAERMENILHWRDDVAEKGWRSTVLDWMTSEELHQHLFTKILFPPQKLHGDHDKTGLKVQIEALIKVLTTPGAWLDLSVPEARLRFGKIIHARKTTYDTASGPLVIDSERKWLLIQLLLSMELVVRLDAALRLGIALHAESFELHSDEIHHFNKLRNLKVDWDLVMARRFLTLCYIRRIESRQQGVQPSTPNERTSDHRPGFLSRIFSHGGDTSGNDVTDTCDIAILPRQPRAMVDGLIRFASNIGWPRALEIQDVLHQKLCQSTAELKEKFLIDAVADVDNVDKESGNHNTTTTSSLGNFYVDLHPATPLSIGGWLSHSWLSGFVMPGNSICDMLISTLLENDTDTSTLPKLQASGEGRHPLRGSGFILNGSSWWSKSSIVGRVLAPMRGVKECLGWIHTPNLTPLREVSESSSIVDDTWVKVKTFPVPTTRDSPRILDGDLLAAESTPLGMGTGGIKGHEFSMVTDHILVVNHEYTPEIEIKDMQLYLSASDHAQRSPEHLLSAWMLFNLDFTYPPTQPDLKLKVVSRQVRYGLDRAVYFIAAFPCRPPHGHATFRPGSSDAEYHKQQEQTHPHHRVVDHLPAHPLHRTYKFTTKTLAELLEQPEGPIVTPAAKDSELWVVDARSPSQDGHDRNGRGSPPSSPVMQAQNPAAAQEPGREIGATTIQLGQEQEKIWPNEILARAWCAEKGRNALIARVGRTCLGCAIREARALEVGIVVRIGVKE